MSALVRAELLMELLVRISGDLLTALGWQGTAVVVLCTLVSRGPRDRRGNANTENAANAANPENPANPANASTPNSTGVSLACVTTVLLAVILIFAR